MLYLLMFISPIETRLKTNVFYKAKDKTYCLAQDDTHGSLLFLVIKSMLIEDANVSALILV